MIVNFFREIYLVSTCFDECFQNFLKMYVPVRANATSPNATIPPHNQ